jgi:hypothetical protein
LFTAIVLNAVSVYVFHDVDQNKIGHLNEAFAELAVEAVIFSLIVGGLVWLFVLAGRRLLSLRNYSPRLRVAASIGVAAAVFQYPFEYIGRRVAPNLSDSFLFFYLITAPFLAAAVLLADVIRQSKIRNGSALSDSQ